MFGFFRRRRRRRLRAQPFPSAWERIIDSHCPYARVLDAKEREELHGHVQVLLAEKTFVGCGGLEVDDEIRVTIAVHAALLLLGRETDYYPTLQTIYVYPSAYLATTTRRLPDGTVVEESSTRLGESWERGCVVLAWDNVSHSAWDVRDGQNVVLHEFAHQLDAEVSGHDGAPALSPPSSYASWARVLGEEYRRLVEKVERRQRGVMDAYGATSPAEFFAVATETFFEKSEQLEELHPELYEELRRFYRQDPAARSRRDRRPD